MTHPGKRAGALRIDLALRSPAIKETCLSIQ